LAFLATPPTPAFPADEQPAAAAPAPPADGDEQDHDKLRELRGLYERAVNEEKLELLDPHLAADFSGVMVTGDGVASMADLRSYWAKIRGLLGEGGKYTVEVVPDRSHIEGDLALAKGTTKEVATTGAGKRYEFSSQWTAVCRRDAGGAWKIVRIHGSMDPVTNPFVKTFLRRTAWTAGGVGAVAGLIVGGLLVFLVSRRRRGAKAGPAAA
jgi:ketosteroid isomerase-like protein